jgi:hypothetical protein
MAARGGASSLVLNSLFCPQMAASGVASINTVHKWQQEEVLALWFLILYSVHRWQQVVALALWLPSMAGGIHVLMFSFTGKELFFFVFPHAVNNLSAFLSFLK